MVNYFLLKVLAFEITQNLVFPVGKTMNNKLAYFDTTYSI